MNSHAEKLLEFEKIKEELSGFCLSGEGRTLLLSEGIPTEPEKIGMRKTRSIEFRRALESGTVFPELMFPPVADLLPMTAKQGSVLEGQELVAIGTFIRSSRDLKRFLEKTVPGSSLREIFEKIPDLESLARELFKFLDPEGNLKEKEIPALRAIRDRMKNLHGEINGLTNGYLQNTAMQTFWQSTTPTLRQGRTVLPMKANFKGRVKGIVHEVSASGATIFIEPAEIVEKNNELVEQDGKYRQEVLRILRELSSRTGMHHAELVELVYAVSVLDSVYARARFAVLRGCMAANVSDGEVKLLGARHPFLGRKAVPIDILIDSGIRTVIITGPNTGGKTVSLKTIGLFALMNQFGLEIPAREGSALPFFDTVLADIGDEQSIEQSLSTFSGHMRNISGIISESTSGSLVLLDELGSGTDPEEGSALAMSILDHLMKKGCLSIVTTHHGILKNYGYTKAGVENACVEFDSENLAPTYRIVVGMPGESHAVDIASRNGIPAEIIDTARMYLSDERTDVGKLIRNLSEKQHELYRKERTHEEREQELREQRRKTDLRELKLRQQERELRSRGVGDLNRFLDESRKMLENLVKDIREGELTKEKTRQVKEFIAGLSEAAEVENRKIEDLETGTIPEQIETAIQVSELLPGMDVILRTTGRRGTLVRKGKNDAWVVTAGSLKFTVAEKDITGAAPKRDPSRQVEISVAEVAHDNSPAFELDVRGMRLEEALDALRLQMDRALLSGLGSFSIIHGRGEGILQKGIHDYLKSARSVREFHFSRPEEGGFGKTEVALA